MVSNLPFVCVCVSCVMMGERLRTQARIIRSKILDKYVCLHNERVVEPREERPRANARVSLSGFQCSDYCPRVSLPHSQPHRSKLVAEANAETELKKLEYDIKRISVVGEQVLPTQSAHLISLPHLSLYSLPVCAHVLLPAYHLPMFFCLLVISQFYSHLYT